MLGNGGQIHNLQAILTLTTWPGFFILYHGASMLPIKHASNVSVDVVDD